MANAIIFTKETASQVITFTRFQATVLIGRDGEYICLLNGCRLNEGDYIIKDKNGRFFGVDSITYNLAYSDKYKTDDKIKKKK